jgi:hypothetical protein
VTNTEGKGPVLCKGCRFGRWEGSIMYSNSRIHVCIPPLERGWGHVEGAYWVTQTPSVLNKDGWCPHFAQQLPVWRRITQWVRDTAEWLKTLVGDQK